MLLVRAISSFLALPALIAFAIPIWIGRTSGSTRHLAPAAVLLCLGALLVLWCVREFYTVGRGTLAPWDPPRRLVTSGPYRISRNPMYIGVATILVGWCILWDSRALAIYSVLFMIAVHLRVIRYEEPWRPTTSDQNGRHTVLTSHVGSFGAVARSTFNLVQADTCVSCCCHSRPQRAYSGSCGRPLNSGVRLLCVHILGLPSVC